ncbi:MAG: metallophosphoesterase family protein [Candidatus Ornithomonoglobus sp.]
MRICIMSDLHFGKKRMRVEWALANAARYDAVIFAGDIVNDGTSEQFKELHYIVEKYLDGIPVFCAAGNHDFPIDYIPEKEDGVYDYFSFQEAMRRHSEKLGAIWQQDKSGAYYAQFGNTAIIGLNCVTYYRRFKFEDGAQLVSLDKWLKDDSSQRRIIVCHAPLIAHNPRRKKNGNPYLSRDSRLQEIVDRHGNIIFVSGHTHFSPLVSEGCIEYDSAHNNVYINDGSVCPNANSGGFGKSVSDGNFVGLDLRGRSINIDVEIFTRKNLLNVLT